MITPDEVPDELVEIARRAAAAAPQKRDGRPTRTRHAVAAVLSAPETRTVLQALGWTPPAPPPPPVRPGEAGG